MLQPDHPHILHKAFQTTNFSYVQFILCHLYLNKAVKIFKKTENRVSCMQNVIGAASQLREVER